MNIIGDLSAENRVRLAVLADHLKTMSLIFLVHLCRELIPEICLPEKLAKLA